jgi:hypothetical protein
MSQGVIPQSHTWCSDCIRMATAGPCSNHRQEDGTPVEYTGPDAYEPTDWVLSVELGVLPPIERSATIQLFEERGQWFSGLNAHGISILAVTPRVADSPVCLSKVKFLPIAETQTVTFLGPTQTMVPSRGAENVAPGNPPVMRTF